MRLYNKILRNKKTFMIFIFPKFKSHLLNIILYMILLRMLKTRNCQWTINTNLSLHLTDFEHNFRNQ